MASLKEVKRRIISVEGTKKITVARQMISSALLHKTQDTLVKVRQYKEAIDNLYGKVAANTPYRRRVKGTGQGKTGIILISSNSGMCGPYNMNLIREAAQVKERYPDEELVYFPVGKKIREAMLHKGIQTGFGEAVNWDNLLDKPSFDKSAGAVRYFSGLYESGQFKRLIVVHTHFKSIANQEVRHLPLLPYTVTSGEKQNSFIVEPSPEVLQEELEERSLRAAFHTIIIDSLTSEYAARTLAMQMASDNANELLTGLQIAYNKLRQQNITTELLDIVGSSFA